MNPRPDSQEELERTIHRTLRELPTRRAPATLEQRVLAELQRRAALPWWRKSFAHWPLGARAGFIVVCAGMVKFAMMLTVWVTSGFDAPAFRTAFAQPYAWMENIVAVVNAITSFVEIMLRNIPALWLYGGLAFIAAMYATLFGLGAAAYKVLRTSR